MNDDSPGSPTPPRQILLVDDNADKREALRDCLRTEGYQVHSVGSGEAAVHCLASTPGISMMLSDLSLPGMEDGLRLIRSARASHPGLTVIVYTGRDVTHGLAAVSAGASFFVEFRTTEELLGIVNALATKLEIEEQLQIHKLRGAELQRIFDAVGVELIVRDRIGEITMVNRRKEHAWLERGQIAEKKSFIGQHHSPDGPWDDAARSGETDERRFGSYTLLINNKPILNEGGDTIGWVEATWCITRRTRLVEFIQKLEQEAAILTKQQIADRIVDFLAEFTGGRVRFYLRIGQDYRGYAAAKMPPGFDVKAFKLGEQDEERESAFKDHSVKTGRINMLASCHGPLTLEGATEKLFIPLFRRLPDDRLGFVVIDNKLDPSRAFCQEDRALISLFRSFIEVVMKGAITRDEEAQEREWLTALNKIEEELALTDDVKSVYSRVLAIIQEMTKARSAVLKNVQADGSLVTLECRGEEMPLADAPFIPPEGSMAWKSIQTGEIQMVSNGLVEDPGMQAFLKNADKRLREYHIGTKSVVMLPLKTGGKTTALCVLHFAEERALSAIDQKYGQKLLGFLAQAMARMKQFERIRADASTLVITADAGQAATSLAHSMANDIMTCQTIVSSLREMVTPRTPIADEVHCLDRWLKRMGGRLASLRDWIVESNDSGAKSLRADVLEPIIHITEAQLAEQSVQLSTRFAAMDIVLQVGATKLRLALLDFVQNALRVMPKGGKLELGFEKVDGLLHIYVADTGHGWPDDIRAALEADPHEDIDAPIGLGLYLARLMIDSIGGRIVPVVSRLDGKGAEIRILLGLETSTPNV